MSAVQGSNSAAGWLGALLAVLSFSRGHLRVASDLRATVPASDVTRDARMRSLVERQCRQLGADSRVLELTHGDRCHQDWVPATLRYTRIAIGEDGDSGTALETLRQLPAGGFDLIFSVDAIEHMCKPWRVVDEVHRLLRPRGVTVHSTCFSAEYDAAREDFCRFTPDGLKALFGDFDCQIAEFESAGAPRHTARSRTNVFAGCREGWQALYCGRRRG